jgi:CRISPR/Cas system CMR-associated protein Cmr3 (group 5 of RAMP superfamily)
MKSILLSIVAIALFTACSGKKYYEPEETSSNIELNKKSMSSSIKSMNRVGATLEDNEVITKQGISSFKLPDGFEFLNFTDDGKVIATNYVDKILIGERERTVKARNSLFRNNFIIF